MAVQIVFETHQLSEDNERGNATGWLDGKLSVRGRALAQERGAQRRGDDIAAVFTSDLGRAVETALLAVGDTTVPILHDWRLRECDYGELNGQPAAVVHGDRRAHLDVPYPGGESWRQAIDRAGRVLDDLPTRWSGCRVLMVGHVATRWALDHFLDGVPVEELVEGDFDWREDGWEYALS